SVAVRCAEDIARAVLSRVWVLRQIKVGVLTAVARFRLGRTRVGVVPAIAAGLAGPRRHELALLHRQPRNRWTMTGLSARLKTSRSWPRRLRWTPRSSTAHAALSTPRPASPRLIEHASPRRPGPLLRPPVLHRQLRR